MLQQIELWGFLAGLGLFLLGMYMLEQGLRGLGSRSMKKFLREQTRSPIRGVFTGTIVTAFLQSSSLVGLIALAFVGAGIFELRNALGIILGSNLGTTFTGWIVILIGFKMNLVAFAQPMLAVGALGTVFLKQGGKPYFYSNLLLGLGLLLMGLGQMSDAFTALSTNVDVTVFRDRPMLYYFLAGALLTAVIQSSSVSMMILLTAIYTGVITLNEAAPFAIGANLGTTSTVLLGGLKGSGEKRRVALSHFFFNVVTSLLALLMLPLLLYFISDLLFIRDPLYSLVLFHSLFNVIGILLFLPLLEHYIRFLGWLVPVAEYEICAYIKQVPAKVTDAAIAAIEKELIRMCALSMRLNLRCFKIMAESISRDPLFAETTSPKPYEDDYAKLKRAGGELLGYNYTVQTQAQDEDDVRKLTRLNHAIRNATYAAKFIKDVRHNLADFRHSQSPLVESTYADLLDVIEGLYPKLADLLLNKHPELAVEKYEELKDAVRTSYERVHQDIYHAIGKEQLEDEEASSLLNTNREIYLSNSALLESVHVIISLMNKPEDIPPPVIQPAM